MTFNCPVCGENKNSRGDAFNGQKAVATHISGKALFGDPDHFRWLDKTLPGSLVKDADAFTLAWELEAAVPQLLGSAD